jgi:dienelactone hydrolase
MFQPSHYDSAMIQERHISVPRSARYYLLGEMSPQVDDVWFVCHGYGQLASDFVKEFECIARSTRLIVAPEALSRFYMSTGAGFHAADARIGATWMTREDREAEISDYVGYLDILFEHVMQGVGANASVTVLGFSQGGATANRWVTRGVVRTNRLIMWGSLLAADSDLGDAATFFRDVDLSIVYGTRDQFADSGMIAKYEKLLQMNGIPYRSTTFEGGHRMDRDTLGSLASPGSLRSQRQ